MKTFFLGFVSAFTMSFITTTYNIVIPKSKFFCSMENTQTHECLTYERK